MRFHSKLTGKKVETLKIFNANNSPKTGYYSDLSGYLSTLTNLCIDVYIQSFLDNYPVISGYFVSLGEE